MVENERTILLQLFRDLIEHTSKPGNNAGTYNGVAVREILLPDNIPQDTDIECRIFGDGLHITSAQQEAVGPDAIDYAIAGRDTRVDFGVFALQVDIADGIEPRIKTYAIERSFIAPLSAVVHINEAPPYSADEIMGKPVTDAWGKFHQGKASKLKSERASKLGSVLGLRSRSQCQK